MTSTADGEQPVTLVSSDNAEIHTTRKIAERSMLIKNMIEDLGAPEEPIPIMNVSCLVPSLSANPICGLVC